MKPIQCPIKNDLMFYTPLILFIFLSIWSAYHSFTYEQRNLRSVTTYATELIESDFNSLKYTMTHFNENEDTFEEYKHYRQDNNAHDYTSQHYTEITNRAKNQTYLYQYTNGAILDMHDQDVIPQKTAETIAKNHYDYYQNNISSAPRQDFTASIIDDKEYFTLSIPHYNAENDQIASLQLAIMPKAHLNDFFSDLKGQQNHEIILLTADTVINSPAPDMTQILKDLPLDRPVIVDGHHMMKKKFPNVPLYVITHQKWGFAKWIGIFSLSVYLPCLLILTTILFLTCRTFRREHTIASDANKLLEDAVESTINGFLFYSEDGNLFRTNKQAQRYLGQNVNIATLNDFLGFMYDHAAVLEYDILSSINLNVSGKDTIYEFKEIILLDDNRLCLVQIQNTRHGDVVVIMSDISEFTRLETDVLRLTQENHKLISAVEATKIGICISDPTQEDNPITFANKSFLDSSWIKGEDIQQQSFNKLISAQTNAKKSQEFFSAIEKQGEDTIEIEIEEDGASRWFELKSTKALDKDPNKQLIVSLCSDITQNKIREGQFVQAQKLEALGQVAGGVAHDFNNVLSIVDGYARMLRGEYSQNTTNPEQIENYLDRIQLAAKRGASLTKQLLTFGRHRIIDESACDLVQVIKENEALLHPLLDARITLDINVAQDKLPIACASDTISQIIMNLVINARDAMKATGGVISIHLFSIDYDAIPSQKKPPQTGHETYACLSVQDTGTGISKDIIERIFDPFFSTKDQGQGTGLGLSMIYGIVQQLSGIIDVQSQIGMGTNMLVYLPLTDKEPDHQVIGCTSDISNLKLKGYTALIAEDEPDLRSLLANMLEQLGMTVLAAADGNEALMLQDDYEKDIDFLITDVVMPELNGVKLAELFREVRPEAEILFMSGYPSRGQLAKIDLPKDAPFMAKPIQYDLLARLLHNKITGDADDTVSKETQSTKWKT